MRRILLLFEYPTLNGGERSIWAMLEGVRRSGFDVAAVAPPIGPLADALRADGVEVVSLYGSDALPQRLSQARLRAELAGRLDYLRPDLLHANSLAMGRLSGPVAAEAGVPSIAHLRDILKLSGRAIDDLNCHTRILAVSQATRAFHARQGVTREKLDVLYNGVDGEKFRPRSKTGYLHRELGLPIHIPLAGTIGQIALRKGHDVLAQAAGMLLGPATEKADGPALSRGRVPRAACCPCRGDTGGQAASGTPANDQVHPSDLHFVIVGARHSEKAESRRFEGSLHTAAERLSGRFHFLGVRDDVDRLLNELTLLVHPARQEPLGRVLLEAAACGLPIVATAVGGTAEIFPPGSDSARLIPPGDPQALASAVAQLLEDPALRAAMGMAARQRVLEAFDLKRATAGLVEHYRQLIAG
ncbi:MAG: glycosyltransferase family 4 protein [Thermoguttaceae bacterium]